MTRPPARIAIAPDSFKGSISASAAAVAIGSGWRSMRPADEILLRPMADGGEGTLDAFAAAHPQAVMMPVRVTGPRDREVEASWLLLEPDARGRRDAVVELAGTSGIELLGADQALAPLGAHTRGFGQAIRAALEQGVHRLILGIGSSASSDGGAGVLTELGAVVRGRTGASVPDGAIGLAAATSIDIEKLLPPPDGGVLVLTDVGAPLLGPGGAAHIFGPQKGADAAEIRLIEAALSNWARLLGADPEAPGAGAAGGAGLGLSWWGADLGRGAVAVARLIGLESIVVTADYVICGEGSYDRQSAMGKAPSVVAHLAREAGVSVGLVAGRIESGVDFPGAALSLVDLAGSTAAALADPARWLTAAGAALAARFSDADAPAPPW